MNEVTVPPAPSPASLPCVVALIRDREGQARIAGALRDRAELVLTDGVAAFEAAVRANAACVRVLIATPTDVAGISVLPRLERVRALAPLALLIGYFRNGYSEEQEILAFARSQMNGMAFRHVTDTPVTLGAVIARSVHASVADEVLATLRPLLPPGAMRFVSYGVQHAYEQTTVEELASALGRHRKTISEQCVAAGLPVPSALLAWCRFFVFGYLLDHGTASIEDLVLTLDFPSPSALRTQLKRYTGQRALELRAAGALEAIVAAFLAPDAIGRERRAPRSGAAVAGGNTPAGTVAGDPELQADGIAHPDEAVR